MQVILVEDVPNLGSVGDLVKVKPGYARNHLLPKRLAVLASVKHTRQFEHQKKVVSFRAAKARAADESLVTKLAKCHVQISRKSGEQGKLYGSVTSQDLETALTEFGVQVDRRKMQLGETIRALGEYDIKVKLRTDLEGQFKLSVVAEKD
jgi:large subunit ribosomal protein L9